MTRLFDNEFEETIKKLTREYINSGIEELKFEVDGVSIVYVDDLKKHFGIGE